MKKNDNRYNRFMLRKKITVVAGAVVAIMIGYFGASQISSLISGSNQISTGSEALNNSENTEVVEVIFDKTSDSSNQGISVTWSGIVVTGGALNGSDIVSTDNNNLDNTELSSGGSVVVIGDNQDNPETNQNTDSAINSSSEFTYSKEEIKNVKSKVKSSAVKALVLFDTDSYNGYSDNKVVNGNFKKGDEVEIIRDRGSIWYKGRRVSDGFEGWISSEALTIPKDPATNSTDLTDREKECYVNSKDFSSKTNLLVWVDIDRQKTNIFIGEKNKWTLNKSFTCATGLNISPTVRGLFEAGDRGEWFYTERFSSGAKYYTSFSGSYLFHSVSMDKNKNISDPTLGKRVSNGCVRLSVDDAKWIYDNVVIGTKIYVN